MSHMVIFQTPDGSPGYNQFDTVDESVSFVEKLRNEQNVQNARIFKLDELKFEFKPYYRVELAALTAGDAVTSTPSAPAAAPAPAPAAASPFAGAPSAPVTDAATAAEPVVAPVAEVPRPVAAEPPVGAPVPNGNSFSGAPAEDERGRRGLFGR